MDIDLRPALKVALRIAVLHLPFLFVGVVLYATG